MRDRIKESDYFIKYLKEEILGVHDYENDLQQGLIKEDRIPAILRVLSSTQIHILLAEYSSGSSIEKIFYLYKSIISYMEKGWSKEGGYVQMLWMLSFGILLKIDDRDFNRLVALVNKEKEEDYLTDYIIAYRDKNRKLNTAVQFDVPYKGIADATKLNKLQAQACIKQYLEKGWYKGHSDSYWYDNHKSKSDSYFGYWSFESAAITVIMGLDDSGYRDNQYYPKDLADYFRNTEN